MRLPIEQTENYLIVVSDNTFKVDSDTTWYYEPGSHVPIYKFNKDQIPKEYWLKKVLYHLPLGDAPILDGVSLLPELEIKDDAEKLAEEFVVKNLKKSSQAAGVMVGFIEGYRSRAKDYSEKEVLDAVNNLFIWFISNKSSNIVVKQKLLEFLRKTKYPRWFTPEKDSGGVYEFQKNTQNEN